MQRDDVIRPNSQRDDVIRPTSVFHTVEKTQDLAVVLNESVALANPQEKRDDVTTSESPRASDVNKSNYCAERFEGW